MASKSGRTWCILRNSKICSELSAWVHSTRQIRVISLFTDYRIQSNANNEISLALSTTALSSALRSATPHSSSNPSGTSAEEVIMKLAKKRDAAVLSFEIFGASRMGRRVKVEHDVRIEVLKPGEVSRLKEPLCPEPDVSKYLLFSSFLFEHGRMVLSIRWLGSYPPPTTTEGPNNRGAPPTTRGSDSRARQWVRKATDISCDGEREDERRMGRVHESEDG